VNPQRFRKPGNRSSVRFRTSFHRPPGSPWENGDVESFISKLRNELLDMEVINTLEQAKVLTEQWRTHFNTVSPHISLN